MAPTQRLRSPGMGLQLASEMLYFQAEMNRSAVVGVSLRSRCPCPRRAKSSYERQNPSSGSFSKAPREYRDSHQRPEWLVAEAARGVRQRWPRLAGRFSWDGKDDPGQGARPLDRCAFQT